MVPDEEMTDEVGGFARPPLPHIHERTIGCVGLIMVVILSHPGNIPWPPAGVGKFLPSQKPDNIHFDA